MPEFWVVFLGSLVSFSVGVKHVTFSLVISIIMIKITLFAMMHKSRKTAVIIFAILTHTLFAQHHLDSSYLEIRGLVELEAKPLAGALVAIWNGDSMFDSLETNKKGKFVYRLDINNQYTIIFSKNGLASKRLAFNTTIPGGESGFWINEFAIELIKLCDGIDYSILNEPIDNIEFDEKSFVFVSNMDYMVEILPKLKDLLEASESCIQEKYFAAITKADQLYSQKKYREARAQYLEAINIEPSEAWPNNQLEIIQTIIREETSEETNLKTNPDASSISVKLPKPAFKNNVFDAALELYTQNVSVKSLNENTEKHDEEICATSQIDPYLEEYQLFFDFDKSALQLESLIYLDKLAEQMAAVPDQVLMLASYTDSRGSETYNMELSKRRNLSVKNYLAEKGISEDRIAVSNFGESQPKTINSKENDTYPFLQTGSVLSDEFILGLDDNNQREIAHGLNRRVELRIMQEDTALHYP